jgi:hypothetical protein
MLQKAQYSVQQKRKGSERKKKKKTKAEKTDTGVIRRTVNVMSLKANDQ